MMSNITIQKHISRLKRSLSRRWREWCLSRGYIRLGTRYGGWWINERLLDSAPLLIDCGLGEDISFPVAFIERFQGKVVGIEPNPRSLEYCRARCPDNMTIYPRAFWTKSGETLSFHLPRLQTQLPKGADGVSGSLLSSHEYVDGGEELLVTTTTLVEALATAGRDGCDVLKLDIEGAEYEVLAALCSSGEIRLARQVLIEFHHGATCHTMAETEKTVAAIEKAGFTLIYVESRNYIFCRHD